jgi:23S rRNA (guanosine2251-2'-O)-methyltransferase
MKNSIVFGWHPVLEALEGGQDLQKIFILRGVKSERQGQCLALAKERDVPVQFVPPEKLDRLTRKNHQGVVAFLSPVEFADLSNLLYQLFSDGQTPRMIALDSITDVGNFGAICRSAEGLGFHGVVIPSTGSAPMSEDAVKTSSGALLRLPVCRVVNFGKALDEMKKSGIQLIGMTEKASDDLSSVMVDGPLCLVMGNEETGLSRESLRLCDRLVRIPMAAEMGSLNVSVAAGIGMYSLSNGNKKAIH